MNPIKTLAASALLTAIAAHTFAATFYVDLNNPNPVAPYTTWATAATNIQDAIDVASPNDTVLVTNGLYQTGGRVVYGALTNRVAVTKAIAVNSVNGPAFTTIQGIFGEGDLTMRCVYLTNGASLKGFTLLHGGTRAFVGPLETRGGGVYCESNDVVVSDCIIATNAAFTAGGGAFNGTFHNCRFTNNNAGAGQYVGSGGAVESATLTDCVIASNYAYTGGGVSSCLLTNCLLLGNTATEGGGATNCVLVACTLLTNSVNGFGG